MILSQDLDHSGHFEYYYHYYKSFKPLCLQRSSEYFSKEPSYLLTHLIFLNNHMKLLQ